VQGDAPASESDLIIYSDGPNRPEHIDAVEQVRDVVREAAGFKSVKVIERPDNFGLANSIISGVADACESRGKVIVLGDDLVVSPQFLTFLNNGLDLNEGDARVFKFRLHVSGLRWERWSIFLASRHDMGMGTWSRAWRHFDRNISRTGELAKDADLRRRFDLNDFLQLL
jgi:hypothetical protein